MTEELLVADVLATVPSSWRMFGRALRLRCPRCGSDGQFHRWIRRSRHCPGCGYTLERQSDFFFGAYMLNLCVTLFALFCVLASVVVFEAAQVPPPVIPIVVVGLFCATVLPLFLYPYSFTMWAVIDLRCEPLELHEIATAVDNLNEDQSADTSVTEHTHC